MIQQSYQNVIISAHLITKQYIFAIDLQLNQSGCVISSNLIYRISSQVGISQQNHNLFYYDHIRNNYVNMQENQFIPINCLVNQNKIVVKLQPKISDQILANPQNTIQNTRTKRSAQRSIKQSFKLVMKWRTIYHSGFQNKQGQFKFCNLQQAAQCIGISKKTLEDYYLILRIAKEHQFNFSKYKQQKMGFIRQFVKSVPKLSKQTSNKIRIRRNNKNNWDIQLKFFREIGRQLQVIQQIVQVDFQQQLYDVLDIMDQQNPRSYSDEDIVAEQIQE